MIFVIITCSMDLFGSYFLPVLGIGLWCWVGTAFAVSRIVISHRFVFEWIDSHQTLTFTHITERPSYYYCFNVPTPVEPKLGIVSTVQLSDIHDVQVDTKPFYNMPYVKYKILHGNNLEHCFPEIYVPDSFYSFKT
jgi:hypothetical protein